MGDSMSTIINATTTNGVVIQPDNSGSLELQTNSGTTALTIDTSQRAAFVAGTAALPAITTTGDTNTGMFFPAADTIAFAEGGTEIVRINSSGNVLVGDTTDVASKIYSRGATAVDGSYTYFGNNSAGTLLFFVRNDGVVNLGAAANSPYNLTTGSAANVNIAASGTLFRSTSSIKYKTDVQNAVHGLNKVMELRPVTYKGVNDGDIIFGGLIAEEVHDAGLTEFVQYAENGTPDALAYGNMVSLAFKAIQEQQTIINDLKARIETLETK
jgi:hypothetical protein